MATLLAWIRERIGARSTPRAILRRLLPFMNELQMVRRGLTTIFQLVGCALLLSHRDDAHRADGVADEAVWPCLAISFYFHARYCVCHLCVPSKRFGIFSLVVERLMTSEVPLFLTFFVLYLLNFTCTLFLVYPRAGNGTLPFANGFNDPRTAIKKVRRGRASSAPRVSAPRRGHLA